MTIEKAIATPDHTSLVTREEVLAAEAAVMRSRIGAPGGDLIKVKKDQSFELPTGDVLSVLEVVVVTFVSLNQFYEGKYDEKDIKPPVCMALGVTRDDMHPFEKSPNKQDDGKGCAQCWAYQWGSDGRGKRCKDQRMLAVLGNTEQMMKDGPIMLIKVSPTGTRFWDSYVTSTIAAHKALINVVTQISFDASKDYPSLRFRLAGPNSEDGIAFAYDRRVPALERLLVEPDFQTKVVVEPPKKSR